MVFLNEMELRQKHRRFEKEKDLITQLFADYLAIKGKVSYQFIIKNTSCIDSFLCRHTKKYAFSNKVKEITFKDNDTFTDATFKKTGECWLFMTNDDRLLSAFGCSDSFEEISFTDETQLAIKFKVGEKEVLIYSSDESGAELVREYRID